MVDVRALLLLTFLGGVVRPIALGSGDEIVSY